MVQFINPSLCSHGGDQERKLAGCYFFMICLIGLCIFETTNIIKFYRKVGNNYSSGGYRVPSPFFRNTWQRVMQSVESNQYGTWRFVLRWRLRCRHVAADSNPFRCLHFHDTLIFYFLQLFFQTLEMLFDQIWSLSDNYKWRLPYLWGVVLTTMTFFLRFTNTPKIIAILLVMRIPERRKVLS